MKELMYAVECTTDGGSTWAAICVDAVTAINVNEFVMQFLPDHQTSIRIAECDCKSCKGFSESEVATWIVTALGIKVFYTINGKENIFRFSSKEHADEIAAILREHRQDTCEVVMVRC